MSERLLARFADRLRNKFCRDSNYRRQPAPPRWLSVASENDFGTARGLFGREWDAVSRVQPPPATLREFLVPAHCWVCARAVDLHVDYSYSIPAAEGELPNWREHLRCTSCLLNNRMRAAVHFLETSFGSVRDADPPSIYLTEQCTPIFTAMRRRHSRLQGSEFLGDQIPLGAESPQGLRNENLVRLTFADETFDLVASLDVLEHVGRIERALSECHRILRPRGALVFTVPFYPERRKNLVRAMEEDDGTLRHLEAPEYHGDPLSSEGCLAFHHFGWEILDQVRAAGFAEARSVYFWSREYGYLGERNVIFVAMKRS